MPMKKAPQVHGAKFNTLAAVSQNVNLPARTLKITKITEKNIQVTILRNSKN